MTVRQQSGPVTLRIFSGAPAEVQAEARSWLAAQSVAIINAVQSSAADGIALTIFYVPTLAVAEPAPARP